MSSVLSDPDRAADNVTDHPNGDSTGAPVESDQSRITALEDLVAGLTRALQSRDEIGQAKGILVAHYDISAAEAFTLLVRVSQHTNTKLVEIARAFVNRVRQYGPAQQCRVVTEVLEGLLVRTERTVTRCPATGPDRAGRRHRGEDTDLTTDQRLKLSQQNHPNRRAP